MLALLLFAGTTAEAQEKIMTMNKPGYDERPVHYGFYLAVPFTKYNLQHSKAYVDQQNATTPHVDVNTKTSVGFYTGLVLNVRLAQYLDARFVPGVGFYNRKIEFANALQDSGERMDEDQSINSTVIELPFLLKYRAKRRSNLRPYLVAGVKPGIDLGKAKNDAGDNKELRVETFDIALEYGIGLDVFYPYFKFAPELRFSHGLFDQHKPTGEEYSNYIQKLTNHNVSLIFFFE
ncbi:type IX secretion/gliding motility protein PorT/SprT [Pontibacter ummariensis]|uniref:type IX secretion/gliding motility protein PorT/SprT n=1 Tax=Pontibacter ummariensis TaxID=1610492 RepID=UPI001FEA6359|nr:porin family protein [Pontibacter ummariensis]